MKAYLDCYPCLLRQAIQAARLATSDEGVQHRVLREVLRELQGVRVEARPVDFAPSVHAAVRRVTGCDDPYEAVKSSSNERALAVYPEVSDAVSQLSDPLLGAAKLAAAGNIADCAIADQFDFDAIVRKATAEEFGLDHYTSFGDELSRADRILYLADNAGEIVFDRLLIEHLKCRNLTVAVKAGPLLNDATEVDARAAGICDLAEIVTNENGWPQPDLADASPKFRDSFLNADLIIAKGQGNYEALSDSDANLFFLLTAKCSVVSGDLGVDIGNLVLMKAGER